MPEEREQEILRSIEDLVGQMERWADRVNANPDLGHVDGLGLRCVDTYVTALANPCGLVLVAGPRGSGRLTTAMAGLRLLAERGHVAFSLPSMGLGDDDLQEVVPAETVAFLDLVGHESLEIATQFVRQGALVIARSAGNSVSEALRYGLGLARDPVVRGRYRAGLCGVLVQRRVELPRRADVILSECVAFTGEGQVERALEGEVWWSPMADDIAERMADGTLPDIFT